MVSARTASIAIGLALIVSAFGMPSEGVSPQALQPPPETPGSNPDNGGHDETPVDGPYAAGGDEGASVEFNFTEGEGSPADDFNNNDDLPFEDYLEYEYDIEDIFCRYRQLCDLMDITTDTVKKQLPVHNHVNTGGAPDKQPLRKMKNEVKAPNSGFVEDCAEAALRCP